ncbi:MAG: SH3 domain-containing protein [Spirochaetales bacterium]|nr:SH3 domain-containing protein [Spirochaetales bacterium]
MFDETDGIIKKNNCTLYKNANLQAPITGTCNSEEKVAVYDRSGVKSYVDGKSDYWYKIEKKDGTTGWVHRQYIDLFVKQITINKARIPKALSVTATSYIDWKNTYTPAKIFDGNPVTAWLEAADGPGVGEAVTLKLDSEITVDEIEFMPGYFDPKWWKSNNRVKQLKIIYGNESKTITFRDEMKPQKAKLKEAIRFREIRFEIAAVYPSGKDNDTGISEITFYNNGEKVEIDTGGL